MLSLLLVLYLSYNVDCHLLPVVYAAPSAVSHQSRIDVKSTPAFITPVLYSSTVYATYPGKVDENSNTVYSPVLSDTVLTPVALSYFHNLPLARALQSPVFIHEEDLNADDKDPENNDSQSTTNTKTI
ncbi:unnamed protein product [Danaus chrysippus]|uniref:(African queen) hypothetical protein n=1 Tax=Danaus chrysippus TaxID=151541 RepID=A0A8J2QER5_9NEOP|nr:unnamed protein product [Danaus chrysippus]